MHIDRPNTEKKHTCLYLPQPQLLSIYQTRNSSLELQAISKTSE